MPTPDDQTDYADILAICLDVVLSKRATIEACALRYPQYATALRQDLTIAMLTTKLKPPTLSDTKVDAIEARLMKSLPQQKILRPTFMGIKRQVAAIFLAFLLIFAGSVGTVAASADALPDDTLYSVKRWWESVVVFIATIIGTTETVLIQLAETRLDEMVRMTTIGKNSSQNLPDLASAIETVLRYNSDLTSREYDFLQATHQFLITSSMGNMPLAQQLLTTIIPVLNSQTEQPPASDTLSDTPITPTPTATVAPSMVLSPTVTATASSIISQPQVVTATPSATFRIPPTPTRTPTPTITATINRSGTTIPTPTATWTAFPTSTPAPTHTATVPVSGATQPTNTNNTLPIPSVTWYPWQQATWDVCYLTRTVDPYGNINDPYCNSTLPPPIDPEALGIEVTP